MNFKILITCFVNRSFTETIDLHASDPVVHKHTPYVIILVKMVDEWAKSHGGSLPSTRDEKREFKVCSFPSASTLCLSIVLLLPKAVQLVHFTP